MARLELKNISKVYDGRDAVADISLTVNNGEMYALLGPSGSGKTTLLKIIGGLVEPSRGQVLFNDEDYTLVPTNKRNAIIVFQDYVLFPHMTVFQNIAFGLRARKVPEAIVKNKVQRILELIQLPEKMNSMPSELSGGQKQRVALARAVVLEPSVLLLDEPFSNLDANLRQSMRDFVAMLQKRLQFTCILVTHDKEEAFMLSERVAVIIEGQLQQVGTAEEVYARPTTRSVAEFIGEANFIQGSVAAGTFTCALGSYRVAAPDTPFATGMFRWDQVQLSLAGAHRVTIVGKKFAGKLTYYELKTENGLIFQAASMQGGYCEGQNVTLDIAPPEMLVF